MSGPKPASLDAAMAIVAARQHSLITSDQVMSLGGSPTIIRRRLGSGRWIRVEHGIYRIAGSAFTWHTRILATCLASGGVASHRTAAALWGLSDSPRGGPEITIARNRSYRRQDVRVHESSDLVLANVRSIEGIPTTGVGRTLIDLGAVVPDAWLEEALFDAINRKLLRWPDLWEAFSLHARRGRNGIGAIRRVLELNYGLAVPQSKLEVIMLRLIDDAGLPLPDRQVTIADEGGPFACVDFAYVARRVALEVDGRSVHARREALVRDHAKRNRISVAGWTLLVFTSEALLRSPRVVCRQLGRALGQSSSEAA